MNGRQPDGRPRPWGGESTSPDELLLDLRTDLIAKVEAWYDSKTDDETDEFSPAEEHLACALTRVQVMEQLMELSEDVRAEARRAVLEKLEERGA